MYGYLAIGGAVTFYPSIEDAADAVVDNHLTVSRLIFADTINGNVWNRELTDAEFVRVSRLVADRHRALASPVDALCGVLAFAVGILAVGVL